MDRISGVIGKAGLDPWQMAVGPKKKVGSKIGGGWASVGWVDGREHHGRREHVVGRHGPSARSCLPVTHVAPNGIREEASPLYTGIQIEDFIDIFFKWAKIRPQPNY